MYLLRFMAAFVVYFKLTNQRSGHSKQNNTPWPFSVTCLLCSSAASYHKTTHCVPAIGSTHKRLVGPLALVDHRDVVAPILNKTKKQISNLSVNSHSVCCFIVRFILLTLCDPWPVHLLHKKVFSVFCEETQWELLLCSVSILKYYFNAFIVIHFCTFVGSWKLYEYRWECPKAVTASSWCFRRIFTGASFPGTDNLLAWVSTVKENAWETRLCVRTGYLHQVPQRMNPRATLGWITIRFSLRRHKMSCWCVFVIWAFQLLKTSVSAVVTRYSRSKVQTTKYFQKDRWADNLCFVNQQNKRSAVSSVDMGKLVLTPRSEYESKFVLQAKYVLRFRPILGKAKIKK